MPQQATTTIFASDLISTFDIYKPEKLNKLFRVKGDQGYEYFMLLRSLGFELSVAQDSYEHYEERFIHDTFFVGANSGAGAPGASVTITVSANSIQTFNSTVFTIYPRKWDKVLFNNEVIASVTDVTITNATTATIQVTPSALTDSIPAVVTGQELVIESNAWAEGSAQPTGRLSGTDKYVNYVQIIKESLNATGTEMTNQDWFDTLMGDDGTTKKILGYVMKGQLDMDYRMALLSSNALLFDKITTNTNANLQDTSVSTNPFVKSTEGLIPATRRAGQVIPYPTGLFSINTLNQIDKRMDAQFCGDDLMWLNGIEIGHQIEDANVNYFKETDINYVKTYFGGDEGLAMSVGFKSFTKSGRTHNFRKMGIFSHPKVGGATGYNYPGMALVLPMNKRKDKKTLEMIPSFGMRYKKLGEYSRMSEVWDVSGAGTGRKVIANDMANFYQRMHIGAHHIGVNRFILLDPS